MRETPPRDRTEWVQAALRQYEAPLIRYACRLADGDLDAARDLVQETFLKLCEAEPAAVDDHLAAWLYTVCRNKALDRGRKEKRMSRSYESALEAMTATDPGPLAALESRETAGRVAELIGHLPDKQQEVLRLKFQEGKSYREISHETGYTVSNVGVLLHYAIKTLRTELAKPDPQRARAERKSAPFAEAR